MTELITPFLSTPTEPEIFWWIDTARKKHIADQISTTSTEKDNSVHNEDDLYLPFTLGEEMRFASVKTKYFGKHVLTEVMNPVEAFLLIDESPQQEQMPVPTRRELHQQERDAEIRSRSLRSLGSRALLSLLKPFRR